MTIQNLSKESLKSLVAMQNDQEGHHMLWVAKDGEIHLDVIPAEDTPLSYENKKQGVLKFRFETFMCGNQYVGERASEDSEWMERLYDSLTKNWETDREGYVDQF